MKPVKNKLRPVRVIIQTQGGLILSVFASQDIDLSIMDWDNLGECNGCFDEDEFAELEQQYQQLKEECHTLKEVY